MASDLAQAGLSDDLSLYLNRNLSSLSRSGLSAGLAVDYAQSPSPILATLSDTDPNVPPPQRPSVLGTIFSHVMGNENHLVPISDMHAYQTRLNDLGYMPPGYEPTGTYDAQTGAAHRLLGDDVANKIHSGEGGFMHSTAGKALDLLFSASMPSHIAKGIFGMVKNFATSGFGTVKRLGGLFTGHYDVHHLGEDLLNAVTLAAMFTGVGEAFKAGEAGLGLFGQLAGDRGAAWLAEHGVAEGARAVALPAAQEILANPSIAARTGAWITNKVAGQTVADSFANKVATYGLHRVSEMPILKVAGGVTSGLAKAAFIPQVAAIYSPNSHLGKAVNAAPSAPWWVDLPAFVIHPADGVIPKPKEFMRAFRVSDFGHTDWARGLVSEPLPDGVRAHMEIQAYVEHQATLALGQDTDLKVLADRDPGTFKRRFGDKVHKEMGKALVDAELPTRGVNPDYAQAAHQWASEQPHLVRAHLMDILGSAQSREARGLLGSNQVSDWLEAQSHADRIFTRVHQHLPAFEAADAKVKTLSAKLAELTAGAAKVKDETQAAGWTNDIKVASTELAQAKREAKEASRVSFFHEGTPPEGYEYDTTARVLTEQASGVPVSKRIFVMRADNPATKQNLADVIQQWKTGDRVALRPRLNELGLGAVDDSKMLKNLQDMHATAATDIMSALPTEWQQEFTSRQYKAVAGGHHVLLPSDVNPSLMPAQHFSKLSYAVANLGASPVSADPKDIAAMARISGTHWVDDYLYMRKPELFPHGSGNSLLRGIAQEQQAQLKTLSEMGATSKMMRFQARVMANFTSIHDVKVPEISKALKGMGIGDAEAASMATDIKHGLLQSAATPDLLRSPHETYGVLDKLAGAMRIHGLQGLSESLRALSLPHGKVWGKIPANAYGFLPDNLMKASMALRFALNPLAEARFATKQPLLHATAENLPPEMMPLRRMNRLGILDGEAAGERAGANQIFSRVTGADPNVLADLDRQAINSGVLGYNGDNHVKFTSWRVYQREYGTAIAKGLSAEQADAKAISYLQKDPKHILGYGARAPLEKSINAVYFPFSFEKKLVGQVSEWLSADPVRIFMAHHTMKTIDHLNNMGPGHQTRIGGFIRKYVPLFNEVQKLNAFTHGISLGEFGGVYSPLAQALALPATAVMGALHPFGVSHDNADQFSKLLPRLVPGWKAVHEAVNDALEQASILARTKPMTQEGQLDEYFTHTRDMEQRYSNTAFAFGAAPSMHGFQGSSKVPDIFKQQYRLEKAELEKRFPDAAKYALKYGASQQANDYAVRTILGKVNKTPLDQAVLAIETLRNNLDALPTALDNASPASRVVQKQIVGYSMRNEGLRLFNLLGKDWNDLWIHLGYQHEFGPLAEKVV